jgi:uncharacterized protein (TIGR00299 family) protein
LHHILEMIDGATFSEQAKARARRVFKLLAAAEANVHGTTIEKVHFHEVGAVDSIADIVGCAIAFDLLGIDSIVCSPVPTGHGHVEIAHGRCSIPAPATAELLRFVPLAALDCEGELTTPTGAAIIAALASNFGLLPPMKIECIGYGAGQMDFPQPNILRILIGEAASAIGHGAKAQSEYMPARVEAIVVLETNLDNATGELVAHATERLWSAGALDIAVIPVQMKKARPGVILSVQSPPDIADKLEQILFMETPTLGVRRSIVTRTVLARDPHLVETPWGKIIGKIAFLPNGSRRFSPEYDACRAVSQQHNVPLAEVVAAALDAFHRAGDA